MPEYHNIPTIEYHPSPEKATRPLHEHLDIRSILDVGAGMGGVFDEAYWTARPMAKCDACDIFWMKALPPKWSMRTGVDVQELSKHYPLKSYDMVQCMEVLEHVPNPRRALEELCKVARKFVLISSADEMHHVGEEQARIEKINVAQKYIKQPSIEDLRELGFVVRVTAYNLRQIVAWRVL